MRQSWKAENTRNEQKRIESWPVRYIYNQYLTDSTIKIDLYLSIVQNRNTVSIQAGHVGA